MEKLCIKSDLENPDNLCTNYKETIRKLKEQGKLKSLKYLDVF